MIIEIPLSFLIMNFLLILILISWLLINYFYSKIIAFDNLLTSIRKDNWLLTNNLLINKALNFNIQNKEIFLYDQLNDVFEKIKFSNIEKEFLIKEFDILYEKVIKKI